jgi:DNA-binding beta-propeller fold protein YncE
MPRHCDLGTARAPGSRRSPISSRRSASELPTILPPSSPHSARLRGDADLRRSRIVELSRRTVRPERIQRVSARLRRRTASLAVAATFLLPAGAHAAVGDIAPLEGLSACNATTAFAGTTCTPGSPIGQQLTSDFQVGATIGRRVLSSPDGKHVYVISVSDGDGISGRVGVFDRERGGALTPSSCLGGPAPPPPSTPQCALSGSDEIDSALLAAFLGPQQSNAAAFAPDGRQLFVAAGPRLVVLDRDPTTGTVTGRQALPPSVSNDVAVSPDGFNVYEAAGFSNGGVEGTSQLNVFARTLSGALVRTQCFNQDGSGGCTRVGGLSRREAPNLAPITFPLTGVTVSPDGSHVYASTGRTVIPLSRNADGTLAPLVDDRFGKQIGCFSFFSGVQGCATQQIRGLRVDDLEVSPDGRHLYAGTTAFRRDAGTGRLSTPTPVPFVHTPPSSIELSVSPDGRTVYYVDGANLTAIARDPGGTMAMTALPAPGGCFTANGRPGCQTATPARFFRDVAIDPAGDHLYLSTADTQGAIVRAFSRQADPPLTSPIVGRARLTPRHGSVTAGRIARLKLVWTHPRKWRDLTGLELKLRSPRGLVGHVRADARTNRIRAVNSRGLQLIARRSSLHGSGPKGHRITLRVALLLPHTIGRKTLRIDALAQDRRGNRQSITKVGTLKIRRAQ